MYCPRFNHNVRLNTDGTVSLCGHMVNAPRFPNYQAMLDSAWLSETEKQMARELWPAECERCRLTEEATGESVRTNQRKFAEKQKRRDWLSVGGVLDNVCNSACATCNANHSSRIADLAGISMRVNNTDAFAGLPQDRITHLDISGGEPSYSKNYRSLLDNLPPNLESIRLNTNCSTVLKELTFIALRGIRVTVTVSFDGVGRVHNYIRWPVPWEEYERNLQEYRNMPVELNLWTTVSALNINNLPEIMRYVVDNGLDHSWAPLVDPEALDIRHRNSLTLQALDNPHLSIDPFRSMLATGRDNQDQLDAYIQQQDQLRGTNIKDCL